MYFLIENVFSSYMLRKGNFQTFARVSEGLKFPCNYYWSFKEVFYVSIFNYEAFHVEFFEIGIPWNFYKKLLDYDNEKSISRKIFLNAVSSCISELWGLNMSTEWLIFWFDYCRILRVMRCYIMWCGLPKY